MSPGPEAEDENVPVARSIERAVVTALSDAARSGVTKYAYDGICRDSVYSFAALLSKSKADMPTRAEPGSTMGTFMNTQE